ncbi:MAG: response regulator [Proteobacteria bacterium]|nr:response regulator [Pseudomonadota bacterium]MBU1715274.1 response regulator [Pseudomonadota bacterium]
MKILIVDDIAEDRRLLRYIAERQGHEVLEAENGLEGYTLAASSPRPDLIISDALMPIMDGFQFLRRVRADGALDPVKFIFYSATYKGDKDKELAFSLGADGYLTKPQDPKTFWSAIEEIIAHGDNRHTPSAILTEDEEYLKQYGKVVGAKLEKKIRALEEAKAKIEESERNQTILNRIAHFFLTVPDDQVFSEILAVLLEVFQSRFGIYGYVDNEGNLVIPSLTRDVWSECQVADKSIVFPQTRWGESLWGKALVTQEAFFSDGPFQTPEGHIPITSFLTVPIVFDRKSIGILSVANKEGGYTEQDRDLLEMIAANISPILKARRERDLNEEQRSLAVESLRASEEFNRNILDTVDEGFIVVDRDYRILSANKAFCSMAGREEEEVVGKACYKISHHSETPCFESGEECPVRRTIESGEIATGSHIHTDTAGFKHIVELKAFPFFDDTGEVTSVIETINDVTEKHKLEEQLRQAQKMEAVGTLAGGVAHDFNNMLSVILGYSELAAAKIEPDHPLVADLNEIRTAAKRSADLTRQLLAFARKQANVPKVLNPNETITSMLKMLRRLIGEDIELLWQPGTEIWPIRIDPSQIDQILANLCVNARDAIAGVGTLTISTANTTLEDGLTLEHLQAKPGDYVQLSMSDTGCGMDRETIGKIFEPFFTTKGVGHGTGLGLATVYGIVRQNNGAIHVYSEPGRGTTFNIYLPRHLGEILLRKENGDDVVDLQGNETILLVEDELTILNMVNQMLTNLGYQVLATDSPLQAIRIAEEQKQKIHLLLTDIIMPEMDGQELAGQIITLHPAVKCLFMSGYPGDAIAGRGVLPEGGHFIQKPFPLTTMATKIREVLTDK